MVKPVTKMKKWFGELDLFECRETPVKTRYGEEEAGPSEEQKDEDVTKPKGTNQNLYQRELQDRQKHL